MTFSKHYEGWGWIKVKEFIPDDTASPQTNYRKLLRHHNIESAFLIEEIRKLAKVVDFLSEQGWGNPCDYEDTMKIIEENKNEF